MNAAAPGLRIAIAGAGGIGAFLGARLQRAGCAVLLLARGAHAKALAEGLQLDEEGGESRVPLAVADTQSGAGLHALGAVDWVLFTCKSQHTGVLAQALRGRVSGACRIASFQNGVDNEPLLEDSFARPVTGGLCRGFYAHLIAPGRVRVRGAPLQVVLGDYPTGLGAATAALAEALQAGGLETQTSTDIRRALWLKLVLNNAINPVSALVAADSRTLLADADYSWVVRNLVREAAAAAAADDVEFSPRELEELLGFLRTLPPIVSSMQTDAERGQPLELEAITGAVLRRSADLGLEAPVTATLHHLLAGRYGAA